jgi:hypothetical protein
MTGPSHECMAPLAAHSLILGSIFLWSISIAPYFWFEVDTWVAKLIPIIGYTLGIAFEYVFLKAEFMDPGVLYREIIYEDEENGFLSERTQMRQERAAAKDDLVR